MLPTAILAAPKIRSTEAAGSGHHPMINIMKRKIIMWRIGQYNELWDDAMALVLH